MKAAVYYRVSSPDQAKRESIESQKDWISPWLQEQGWTFEEFQDDGIPGEAIESRPGFASMLNRLDEFDYLVVFDVDRIGRFKARSDKAAVTEAIERHLKGVWLYNEDDVDGFFYDATNQDRMDELERALTDATAENRRRTRKIRAGQRRARSKGHYTTGRLPYGIRWDNQNKEFIVDEDEYRTLKAQVRLIKDGYSTGQIAKILNGSPEFSPPRHAKKWTDGQIIQRLKTDYLFNGQIVSHTHGTKTDTGIYLFTEAEILEVRERLVANKRIQKKKGGKVGQDKSDMFLYRIARCTCNWFLMAVHYKISGHIYKYYRCRRCSHAFQAKQLEDAVWNEFLKVHSDPNALYQSILDKEFVALQGETAANWLARLKAVEDELKEIEKAKDETQVEYFTKRRMKSAVYNRIIDELESRAVKIREEKETAKKALEQPKVLSEAIDRAVNAVATQVELVVEMEELWKYVKRAKGLAPEHLHLLQPLLDQARIHTEQITSSVDKAATVEDIGRIIVEMKRKILLDQVSKGGWIKVSRHQVIAMNLVASESFNLQDNRVMPA